MRLKATFGIRVVSASRVCLFCRGVFSGPMVGPVQWEICGINSCGERRWRVLEI